MTEREGRLRDNARQELIVVGGPEFYIMFSAGSGFRPDDPIGFLTVVTPIGHKLPLEYDVVDTDIEDHYTFPVCGAAGGSHTIEFRTTVWTGDMVRQERLCQKEGAKKNRTIS